PPARLPPRTAPPLHVRCRVPRPSPTPSVQRIAVRVAFAIEAVPHNSAPPASAVFRNPPLSSALHTAPRAAPGSSSPTRPCRTPLPARWTVLSSHRDGTPPPPLRRPVSARAAASAPHLARRRSSTESGPTSGPRN